VRTAAIPDAEPLPPLLPTTAGWRWPWLVASAVVTLTAAGLFVHTLPRVFQFLGATQGGDYTEWVYGPQAGAFLLAFAVGIVVTIALCMRRWRATTRNVLFGLFVVFSLTIGIRGEHESTARRHIAPRLLAVVDAFHTPAGALSAGPAALVLNDGHPESDVLAEPSASRSWQLPTDSATAACAAVTRMVAGESGWQPRVGQFYCEYDRRQGRVFIRIEDNQAGSEADRIDVSAWPTDGWGGH
jgi:hypothetical protein